MSSIGKIFVVLNLVLAAAFVGWAANASSMNGEWKAKHETLTKSAKAEKDALEAELSKVRTELNASKEDLRNASNARDEAKRDADRLRTEKADLEQRNSSLNASVTAIQTTLEGITAASEKAKADAIKALAAQKDAEAARTAAVLAQQAAEEAQAAADAKVLEAQNLIASLEREKTTLVSELTKTENSIKSLVAMTGVSTDDISNTPEINAMVTKVDTSIAPGLVAINKGSTDGVQRGQVFDIFSGSTYKVRIKIEFVHPDAASGLILGPTKGGAAIQNGDGATTRL
jgi:type II secretory pathway pseudopilin PulG